MSLILAHPLAVIKYLGEVRRYISSLKAWVEPGDMLVCTQLDARYLRKANSVTKKFWETVEVKNMTLVPNEPIEAQDEQPSLLDGEPTAAQGEELTAKQDEQTSLLDGELTAKQDEQTSLLNEEPTAAQEAKTKRGKQSDENS